MSCGSALCWLARAVAEVPILQGPQGHADPLVALPVGLLRKVACVAFWVVVGAGVTTEDVHPSKDRVGVAGLLTGVALLQQLAAEVKRVDQRLVPRGPYFVAGKVRAQ